MAKKRKTAEPRSSAPQAKNNQTAPGSTARFGVGEKKTTYIVFVVLAVLCLVIYAQVYSFDFINIDDDQYVYENSYVSGGLKFANVLWAFTAFHSSNWHPLTWISHQIDSSLFGLNAGAHHLMNVLFHFVNSCLLFVVIRKLTGSIVKSAIVAAIFAVHPAHVESVAWIAERKDVLSTFFWLLSTYFYAQYAGKENLKHYLWYSLLCFAAGLMAKPMLVTLPFTFLLLDFWALKRFDRWNGANLLPLIKEKLPFFALSAASAVITVMAQSSSKAIQTFEQVSLPDRLANAIVSYAVYISMLFYPVNLGVWYPFDNDRGILTIVIGALVVAGISAAAVAQVYRRRYLFAGWFWFLGTLVPVIGLLQVGGQSFADRYTYVPFIGLSIAVVWLAAEFFKKFNINRSAAIAAAGVVIVIFTALSVRQTSFWKNSETLFAHTLSVTDRNYFVEHNFCIALEQKNRLEEAEKLCRASVEHNPKLADGFNTLGTIKLKQNDLPAAKENFARAIEIDPNFVLAYANLAVAETRAGNFEEAGKYLSLAVEKDSYGFFDGKRKLDAYTSIAVESLKNEKFDLAEQNFKKALELAPDNLDLRRNLARAVSAQNRSGEAETILLEAIKKFPNSPEAYNSLGLIYAEQKKKQQAIEMFQKALQLNPGFSPARNNLMMVMQQ